MSIGDLAFIIPTQVAILIAIAAMKTHLKSADILSGRYLHYFSNQPPPCPSSSPIRGVAGEGTASSEAQLGWSIDIAPARTDSIWSAEATAVKLIQAHSIFRRLTRRWLFLQRRTRSQGTSSLPLEPDENQIVSDVSSFPVLRVPATLPPGIRIYAIGDIHGRADLLRTLLEKVDADRNRRPIERPIVIFLGDYIDRGLSSREVLDILLEYRANWEAIFLKGNHETLIIDFLEDPSVLDYWRSYGGLETLLSYGLKPSFRFSAEERLKLSQQFAEVISRDHLVFLKSLQLYFRCGDFLFVHAGIRPTVALTDQDEKDLLWIREDFLQYERPFGLFVVHGHTPVHAPDMRNNRLNIDTGAFATGRLTCVAIEGSTIRLMST